MSLKVMNAVWERADVSQTALLVLLALADRADDEGVCWPSIVGLAERARTSERHVRRILSDLEALGWIEREHRPRRQTIFRINTDPQVREADTQVRDALDTQVRKSDTQVPNSDPQDREADTQVSLTIKNDQKNRQGTVSTRASSAPDGFAEFWLTYPRKTSKRKAEQAYRSALKRASAREIVTGARRFADDPNLPDAQYIPYPATWLNGDRWDDPPLPPRRDSRPVDRQAEILRQEMAKAQAADALTLFPQIGRAS